MSDNENEGTESFIDHIFNALGHASRAMKKRDAERAAQPTKGKRKLKVVAFDEAPSAAPEKECCIAKRGE